MNEVAKRQERYNKRVDKLRRGKLTETQGQFLDAMAARLNRNDYPRLHVIVSVSFGLGVGEWRYNKRKRMFEFDDLNHGD